MSLSMSLATSHAASWSSQDRRNSFRSLISIKESNGASSRSQTHYRSLRQKKSFIYTMREREYSRRQETLKQLIDCCLKDWIVERLLKMNLIRRWMCNTVVWISLCFNGIIWIGDRRRYRKRPTGSRGGQCGPRSYRSTAATSTSSLVTIRHPRPKTRTFKSLRVSATRLTCGHGD